MKKILLLGGSAQQVIAVETAKRLGYATVLCDYLPDNPGQFAADRFYLVSTTDKEAVLEVAQKEQIDGILAYASDPAAPTAAYVAERLGLPGNPYQSVEILCNKDKFRAFLAENGFCTPKAKGYASVEEAKKDIEGGYFRFPIIVKPVDSSGSKGATVLENANGFIDAVQFALSFSRSNRFIVEEYIVKKHPYLIGGDIFVKDGTIKLWGLLNCHRDQKVNPLVPVGKSYPPSLDAQDEQSVKETLQRLVTELHIQNCGMNVELIIDSSGKVYPIDIGPRNGGNMIPDLLCDIFGVDVVEAAVKAAMGEAFSIVPKKPKMCFATYNLHSAKNGRYDEVFFSGEIEPYIYRKCIYKKTGDLVEYFDNASKCLGIVFMCFDSMEQMLKMMDHSEKWIEVKLQ